MLAFAASLACVKVSQETQQRCSKPWLRAAIAVIRRCFAARFVMVTSNQEVQRRCNWFFLRAAAADMRRCMAALFALLLLSHALKALKRQLACMQ